MYKKIFFAAVLFVTTMSVSAQKLSGNISPLKGQKEVNVELDFTGTMVNNQPEESHIAFFSKGKNDEETEKWLKEWNEDMRQESYAKLVADLNKATVKKGFSVGNFTAAEYTIYVKVVNIDPGAFLVTNSRVKAEVGFVRTGETTPFATATYNYFSRSSNFVAPPVGRIAAAFGTLGDKIGSTISKNLK